MFYKLISDGDWFTFAKRKDSVSRSCYSFMPTSTYPKEWKSKFIFVSATMIPESPPLRDAEAAIEDSVPIFSADEIIQWKRMYENLTRAFTFSEGILAIGGLSPSYSVRPKAFFWQKRADFLEVTGVSVQAGGSASVEGDEGASFDGEESSPDSLQVKDSSYDDKEDLESRLARKRKAVSPKQAPAHRDIRLRLRSSSGKKAPPATKATSELPPIGVKGSLFKHLRSSSFVSEPLLGSSHAPMEIPTAPSSSRVREKTPEVSVAHIASAFEISPHHATETSEPSQFEGFAHRSPLAPLFADALPVPYVPKWKIIQSSVVGNPETGRDFLTHAVPPSHSTACHSVNGFLVGVGMLQRVDDPRKENEGLRSDLKASQSVATELRCQVVEAERKLQEEKGSGVMLERKERAWEREMAALVEEKEELAATLKHQKEVDSVYRAYRDMGYQVGLKDGYAYSAQGLGRNETPFYNSKAKKRLSKLDKEFGGKTPAPLQKILEHPMISIDELKALLTPAGPSSPKSLSWGDS
ncbi:hypothetical protein Hdeb2414_s0010g00342401 [Helianthus debilis subsp. tardiflorus]